MKYAEIQSLAIIYGKKELVEEFLDKFHIDRQHDGAPINAVQADNLMPLKRSLWKLAHTTDVKTKKLI